MKSVLKKLVATAFVAATALAASAGVGGRGDIIQVFALDQSGKKFAENSTATLKAGQSFYVLVRLVNADFIEEGKGNSHPWVFRPAFDPSSPEWEKYIGSISTPKIGLFVGGKTRMAEYIATPEFPFEATDGFTDLFFKYTVQSGDLGLPVQLLASDGRIPGEGSTREFKTEGFNTAKVEGQFWALCAPGVTTVTNAQFYLDGTWGDTDIFPLKKWPLNDQTKSTDPIGTDWTLARENVRVQTIDFDETYESEDTFEDPDNPGQMVRVWREVSGNEPAMGLVTGEAGSTVYLWTGDPEVFTFDAARTADARVFTNAEDKVMMEIVIPADGAKAFWIKAGAAAAVGRAAKIYLSATETTDYSAVGDAKSAKVFRGIRVAAPKPPRIKLSWEETGDAGVNPRSGDAYVTITNALDEVAEKGHVLKVELTGGALDEDFSLFLRAKIASDASDNWSYVYTNVLIGTAVTEGGSGDVPDSFTVPPTETNIVFHAGETAKKVWIYPVGSMSKAAKGESIKFKVEFHEASAAVRALEIEGEPELRIRDAKPAVVSPRENEVCTVEDPLQVMVSDSYRDLSAPRTYQVKVAYGSRALYTSDATGFKPGEPTEIQLDADTVYSILKKGKEDREETVTVTVTDPLGQKNTPQSFKLLIPAKPEDPVIPMVSAALYDTTAESSRHDGFEFVEGTNVYVRFEMTNGPLEDLNVYAKLVPLDEASSNKVKSAVFTTPVLIAAGKTASLLSEARLLLLDGLTKDDGTDQQCRFGIELTDKDGKLIASTTCAPDPDGLVLSVRNAKPTILSVLKGAATMKNSEDPLANAKAAVAAGVPTVFTANLADDGVIDLTNATKRLLTVWRVTDGNSDPVVKCGVTKVTGLMASAVFTNTFNAVGQDARIEVFVLDKDMYGDALDRDHPENDPGVSQKLGGLPDFVFIIPINDKPYLWFSDASGNVVNPGDPLRYVEGISKMDAVVYVNLSKPPSGLRSGEKLKVQVEFEMAGDDGNIDFTTDTVEIDAYSTRGELQLDHVTLDGGLRTAFDLTAKVLNAGNDENGQPWANHYNLNGARLWVDNADPIILSVKSPNEKLPLSTTSTNHNVSLGKKYDIEWIVQDVKLDATDEYDATAPNADFTVTWTTSSGLYIEQTADDMTVAYDTKKKTYTLKGKTEVSIDLDGFQSLTMTVRDKDEGLEERTWWYEIPQTKKAVITAFGPAESTQSKYGNAIGLGSGRVYADDLASSLQDGFMHTYCFNVTMSKATVYAFGYPAGADVEDNGGLSPTNRDIRINADGSTWNKDQPYYRPNSEYDSFFYCWVDLSKDPALPEGNNGKPAPAVKPDELTRVQIALGAFDEKKKEGAEIKTLEAVFSREMHESDNLGDINQDGIPDRYVTLYKFGIIDDAGLLAGDDLTKLDAYNHDLDANGSEVQDFLPYMEVSQYSVLIPELPSTWTTEGLPFDAVTEIRGYHWGLNDATAQKTVDGKANPAAIRNASPDRIYEDPDLSPTSTLSKVEWLAYVDAGCPGVDKWSPERPTSPMLADTDGDGFSDGYEYFMWYRAHVGYMDGTNHVYMTGERFDMENPGQGSTITSEEIERLFDPLSKSGDASEALTRDTDNDGLPDLLEFLLGTNPIHWDTDGDGLPDGYEVAMNGGTQTEGAGSVAGITGQGTAEDAAKTVFDPCGRNVGVDEAMYNGDHDAMAYEQVGNALEMVYGFRMADGTVRYYWVPSATNVISAESYPCWTFTQTKRRVNPRTGKEVVTTNLFLTAHRPPKTAEVMLPDGDGGMVSRWVLTESLTEKDCWLARNVSTNENETIYVCQSPASLPRGSVMDADAVESEYHLISYGGAGGKMSYRVFKYGPRFYDEAQPYGQWVCGAEVFVTPPASDVVSVSQEAVFFIHSHVYQGLESIDGARTAWQPDIGWGGDKPYTQLDEFLVCFWHYLDEQPDDGKKAMDMTVRRDRTWVDIWSDYCTDPSTADTDGDGIPDGWELYTLGGPKKYDLFGRVRDYGPRTENSAKNPAGGYAAKFHGRACSIFFGPYCKTIVDGYCNAHPFWTNKKKPTDPWVGDTDDDGLPDEIEEWLFGYLQETEAWKGKVPSYPDAIPGTADEIDAGGGLNPLSWDTDLDGLPDPWEAQYGNDLMGHDETYSYIGEGSEFGGSYSNCWCRLNDSGKYVPTVDGTVPDAGEDYDHDGLLNWQEYLVNAMRCWRYDDTISSWRPSEFSASAYTGGENKNPAFWTERLINGGVFYQKGEDGKLEVNCAGIGGWMEDYDGQYDGYNPQIQVDGMYDIGAGWFSLCTNAFDQAKGGWYMFYDGVYHDLRTGGDKWTVPGMPPDFCNRFTWRSYTLQARNPFEFTSDGSGRNGWYWFGDWEKGDYVVYPNRYPGTDPNDPDTDDDGMDDYWELFHGLNPLLGQSGAYRVGSRPAVDCVYEAYVWKPGPLIVRTLPSCEVEWAPVLDRDPETGVVRQHASAEHNYWTWLDKLEPENPHFAVAKRIRQPLPEDAGFGNTYDFGRFPWLNGLGYADPDGDNIRNQQEAIFPQVQANSTYLHTDPSPLWMTDKHDAMSLTHRYYQLPDVVGFTDESWADANNDHFTDTFGNTHKWTDFPGFEWDEMEGLTLPDYAFNVWDVPNPTKTRAADLATVKVADFGWDFEENEGYDSDKDYLSDFEEEQGRTKNASNPQDADDPLRRQAMWFGGEENMSALQTPMEVDREPPTDNVPSGVDQPFLFFTVECWAKPESNLKDPKLEQVLVERSIWSGASNPADDKRLRKNFQIGIRGSAAGALWYVKYDSSGTDAGKSVEITDGPEVMSNGWTHVAATYDGENLKLYVNGVCLRTLASKVQPEHGMAAIASDYDGTFREGSIPYDYRAITVGASIAKPDPLVNGLTDINLKWYGGFYNQFYKGYIDEVRIWDGARTATEILNSYRKRFTAVDALENRTTVFNAWNVGYTREAVSQGILPAELKYHWNFDHIPGATRPDWVMVQPTGFSTPEDTVDGKAIWSRPEGWEEPWWSWVNLRSTVYTDPAWVPWIVDTVHHLPNYDLTTLDSFYWSEDYVGDLSVTDWAANYFGAGAENPVSYSKFTFPRTHELPSRWTQVRFTKGPPFTISDRYRMICRLIESEDPNGPVLMKRYAFTLRHALCDGYDLLPLGGAYPKRISAAEGGMWDENGAADAWAQSGKVEGEDMVDPTDKGVPNWWTRYYLQNHPELDPDTVIRWDTVLDYNGVPMPAWQAYIRDLAEGLLPDGEIHPEYRDERDMNRNGLPDWWEDFWKLTNRDADADPDNDGLSTYSEYLAVEGDYPYGVTNGFPQLNPTLTYSTTLKVTDYFLSGPTNNLDAKGRHIFANEYLGEIFTDHDFMEDWWERLYARTYADPMKYDPLNDRDEDGWSNFAECRAALWGGFFSADLIDSWTGKENVDHVTCYPEPIIGVRVTYHGTLDISGRQLVIRTISGQSKRVDATFVVPPDHTQQTRYIGPFRADAQMRGHLSPGRINADTVVFQRANVGSGKVWSWNWDWYEERDLDHPDVVSGTFDQYVLYYSLYPHIEMEGAELNWSAFTQAIEEEPGVATLKLNGTTFGTVNCVTGEYVLDMAKFDQNLADYVFRVTYTSRVGHEWPQTVYVSDTKELATGDGVRGNGRVKEGRNTIEVFMDIDGDGKLGAGEPFGVARNVQVGWHKVPEVVIELKDESPIMPVIALGVAGGEGETVAAASRKIAVYRDRINGGTVPDRLLATTTIISDDHPYITEADVCSTVQPDLDWTWLLKDAARNGIETVSSARYHVDELVTLSDGTVTNIALTTFGKQFPDVRPTASAVGPIDDEPIYTTSPTFSFTASDETATGYRLQVRQAGGALVYDSGITVLPGRTGSTVGKPVYAVTPALYADDRVYCAGMTNHLVFADGQGYEWRVALFNAKFRELAGDTSSSWSAWAKFQMDLANKGRYPDQPTGYGVIPLAVRYFGPLTNVFAEKDAVSSNVVVEAYENADFRGQPLARLRLSDVSALRDRADVDATDVLLRGIRPGTVYLRAFIDQNGNGSRDNWESWGYVNMVGKGMRAINNPESFEVIGSAANWELAAKGRAERVIYIEDCDLNCNEIPDCLEPEKFPEGAGSSEEEVVEPITWWEWAEADPDDCAEDDVMAFCEITMRLVTVVSNETVVSYLQPLAEPEPTAGNTASNLVLYTSYEYGYGETVLGLGQPLAEPLTGWLVYEKPKAVKVLLVHNQVLEYRGKFCADTAVPGGKTDTRPFKASDKYCVLRYLESTGRLHEPYPEKYASFADYVMNSGDISLYEKWTLKPGVIDMDHDGLNDGWELYVGMNPFKFADREDDLDKDGLAAWQEFDRGDGPTDPHSVDSDGDGITDYHAYLYHLKGTRAGDDDDGDGLSNYAEYLITEVFKAAQLDPDNPKTDGYCVDYFRKMGELYFGEIFTDHDQVNDVWEGAWPDAANRYAYDPSRDDDSDGWSNFAEAKAGTDPAKESDIGIEGFVLADYPVPCIETRLSYSGKDSAAGPVVIKAWSQRTDPEMTGVADATWTVGGQVTTKAADAEKGTAAQTEAATSTRYVGIRPNGVVTFNLGPGAIEHGSVNILYKDLSYCQAKLNENHDITDVRIGATGGAQWYYIAQDQEGALMTAGGIFADAKKVGTVDYETGRVTVDFNAEYMTGLMLGDPSNVASSGGDTSSSGGSGADGWYDLLNLDDSYVIIIWKSCTTIGAMNRTLYLSDADQTAANGGFGHVREGLNTFIAFIDRDGGTAGEWDPGEPFGVMRDVDVGWDGAKLRLELSETSAITPRIDLLTGEGDRAASVYEATATMAFTDPLFLAIYGTNDATRTEINAWFSNRVTVVGGIGENQSARVRVVRYGIDDRFCASVGVGSATDGNEQLVMLDKRFDATTRSFLCEADFLGDGEFDIDWNTLSGPDFHDGFVVGETGTALGTPTTPTTMGTGPRGAGLVVSNMTYLVVLGDGPTYFNGSGDTNTPVCALATMVTRRFEVTRHKPVAENVEGVVYGARPTFRWSIPDEEPWAKAFGTSYTAFKLQILRTDGTVVYDSGVRRAPTQDKDGFFTWTADAFVGDTISAAGQWKWRVAMYNAKFKPQTKDSRELWSNLCAFSTAAGTQQETDDHNYSSIDVSVKYTGPALVLSDAGFVRVQAFETADFSGTPAAQIRLTDINSVKDATDIRKNGTLIGLPFGTYYVRAYIDTNKNGVKDDWESWGAAKEPVVVKLNQLAPITGLYIEDADTDQDWLPDAWEVAKYGNLATKGADIDPQGKIVLKREIYEALQTGTANISRFLSGASLTFFQNLGNVSLALGVDDVTEATIAEIRKMVEKNIDPNTVKITSLVVDPGNGTNGKVILTVAAKATDSIAGYLLSPVYELPKSTDVMIKVYRKANLATDGWGEPLLNPETGEKFWKVTITTTLEQRIEVPIEGVDFNSGFYKVEIVQ